MNNEPENAVKLIRKLLENLDPKSDAYAWAIALATELNQTLKCPHCGGKGTHAKHYNCGHGQHDAFVRGCNEQVMCKKCHGDARIPKPTAQLAKAKTV